MVFMIININSLQYYKTINTYVPERQKGPNPFLSKLRLCSFLILNFGVRLFIYLYFNNN